MRVGIHGQQAAAVIRRLGIVGVGHLAGYLVEGVARAAPEIQMVLSPRNLGRSAQLAERSQVTVAGDNQGVVDAVDLILLATRPEDALAACQPLVFSRGQLLVSVAAGVPLAALEQAAAPAQAVRALPISCVAINQSPTLLYPDQHQARALFSLLGSVHALDGESEFESASVLSAFYGWVYALLDETIQWTVLAGVPPETARRLVLETVRGAAQMALDNPQQNVHKMLESLATPGGITELGLIELAERESLVAWTEALEAVRIHLLGRT